MRGERGMSRRGAGMASAGVGVACVGIGIIGGTLYKVVSGFVVCRAWAYKVAWQVVRGMGECGYSVAGVGVSVAGVRGVGIGAVRRTMLGVGVRRGAAKQQSCGVLVWANLDIYTCDVYGFEPLTKETVKVCVWKMCVGRSWPLAVISKIRIMMRQSGGMAEIS